MFRLLRPRFLSSKHILVFCSVGQILRVNGHSCVEETQLSLPGLNHPRRADSTPPEGPPIMFVKIPVFRCCRLMRGGSFLLELLQVVPVSAVPVRI